MDAEKLIPEYLIEKLSILESNLKIDPQKIASAICATRYSGIWLDELCFLNGCNGLVSEISKFGLNAHDKNRVNTRDAEYSWLHLLSPLVPYKRKNKLLDFLLLIFSLDNGIKPKEIKKRINPNFYNSFWYSIGGDMLEDCILGSEDYGQYRLDILGLQILESYNKNPELKLYELIKEAKEKFFTVEDNKFKKSYYYELALNYINPKFGHLALRKLANYAPILCKRLIPIESPALIVK